MGHDTIEHALKQEADVLEKALADTPQYQRLKVIRKTLMELQAIGHKSANGHGTSLFGRAEGRTASSIVQAAEFALRDAGHPLTSGQLVEAITRYGKTVGGNKPATNLSNNLSSNGDRFHSIIWRGNRVWWLRGKPIPPE